MTLHDAVANNNLQQVRELLAQQNVQVDALNGKQETPLLVATHHNYIDIAKALIDAGADINKQDAIQDSPYLYAGAQGKTDILAYMLEHREPNQSVYNRYGGNALIPAAEKGHLDNVKLLLADGRVDIDHQNNFGYTALIEAVALTDGSELYQTIVQELLRYNARTDLKDNQQMTALDYAIQKDYKEMIVLLQP
ncbi:hypothetical protein A6M13_08145 [Caryophanon tenue]|uniref:Uncharacterized protein n=2 Tax=Caryophanon tenue TaxID=33978 RepID=A0A1C0YL80_9BACL|nr:hypothetical protein A6M13_08145 [Caryophanon tenue]